MFIEENIHNHNRNRKNTYLRKNVIPENVKLFGKFV